MFARKCVLSLALPFFASALELNPDNVDSIKSAASTLASGIVAAYQGQKELVPGLFPDPYYWWEAGVVFNSLVSYSYLTGDNQYDNLVSEALQHQIGEYRAFMPANQTKSLGNQDQSYWGLAALTAAETGFQKPAEGEWLDLAKNVFDTQTVRWDNESCDGGLKWQIFTFNNGYNYKETFSNGNFMLLAAGLAKATGNATFTLWAETAYDWMNKIGLIDDFHVYDGADDRSECSTINHIQWSSAAATVTEAAAVLYNVTGDNKWRDAVSGFVEASSVFVNSSVLYEVACEGNGKCNVDQISFKGLAARSLARAAVSAPFVSESIRTILEASAEGAAQNCDGEGKTVACAFSWSDDDAEKVGVADAGLSETLAAFEGVQSLLWAQEGTGSAAGSGSPSNSTTTPGGSQNGNSNSTSNPSGTQPPAPDNTGAAGRMEIAASAALIAAMLAVVGF